MSILDSAQDVSLTDWSAATAALATHEPMARVFSETRPLKCLRLQNRFLADLPLRVVLGESADLLTKFMALYSRLGSPDFTRETIDTLSKELGEFE